MPRRAFLADVGMGFTGLALGEMLLRDGICRAVEADAWSPPTGQPHLRPKAKNVIWIFLVGGMSHLESFDPKPALNEFAGQEIGQTPHKDVLAASFVSENLRIVVPDDANGHIRHKLFPMQVAFQKRGQSGLEVSDWWPHLGSCADDLAVVRSMWTTDNNHGAQLQFHTGRHVLEGQFPTIGSWIHYGLGVAQRQPAAVRRARHAHRRLLRRNRRARRPLSGARAQRRAIGGRPEKPAPLRRARNRRLSRRASQRAGASGPTQPVVGCRVSRGCRHSSPHQVVRAGLPHASGRAGRGELRGRDRVDSQALRARSKGNRNVRPRSVWWPDGWSSKACDSCRFFTAATAAPALGTPTAA